MMLGHFESEWEVLDILSEHGSLLGLLLPLALLGFTIVLILAHFVLLCTIVAIVIIEGRLEEVICISIGIRLSLL